MFEEQYTKLNSIAVRLNDSEFCAGEDTKHLVHTDVTLMSVRFNSKQRLISAESMIRKDLEYPFIPLASFYIKLDAADGEKFCISRLSTLSEAAGAAELQKSLLEGLEAIISSLEIMLEEIS